ncbi:hypothetical protein Cgig2_013058 [Carnegiea gigantea]|uniref:Uncharacterized protein n=1 Tax=Carnegiea gigantea TaxID=171969 RepID=A0A9Q1KMK1_9CARY|nr:hypothetical protein Cgig2_013058 [Carnegiea gigantea]
MISHISPEAKSENFHGEKVTATNSDTWKIAGLPMNRIMDSAMDQLFHKLVHKEIINFEEFHMDILDMFSTLNAALPGKHYDMPSHEEVEYMLDQVLFNMWKELDPNKKKEKFVDFMTKLKQSKADDFTLITGLVTPPAAMAAKKAGESVTPLKIIKLVPDVVFVPSATILALISVKIFQKMVKHDQHPTS